MNNKRYLQGIVYILYIITVLYLYSCNEGINQNLKIVGKPIEPIKIKAQINWVGQWAGEGDKERFLRELANEYEFLNQDINVNLKFRDDIYKADEESGFILQQIQKPVADWDILVRMHVNYYVVANILKDPDWGKKYLVDFSEVPGFMESHKEFVNTDMYKKRYGGIYFGPYNEGQLCVLYVNTEVAKKMGISVKQYGMTFDDFLGYIKAAHEYNRSNTYIAPIFEDASWIQTEILFKRLFFSTFDNYNQILDTKLKQNRIAALEKCYTALEELSKYEPIIKNRTKISWWRDNDYPLKDSCLFFANYTFVYNFWKMKGVEKMKKMMPCELPVFKPSDTYMGGYVANWAVLKNSPHKDEAVKLMMYWCKPEVAEKWVRYTKSPSGVKGNMTSTGLGADPFESFMHYIDEKYGTRMIQELDNQYVVGEKNFNIPYHVIDVLEGKMTGKEAFNELKKKLVY